MSDNITGHSVAFDRRPSDHAGYTLVEDCQDCPFWRARWVSQPTLADFGGSQ